MSADVVPGLMKTRVWGYFSLAGERSPARLKTFLAV